MIILPLPVRERLLNAIAARFPRKSFGYLVSRSDPTTVDDFVLFETDIRNSPDWKNRFESYGRYFVEHDDAGFVATPEETWRHLKRIWAGGMVEVGVFHTHLRHPANFSQIDYDMHTRRFQNLWHMIVSVRNPELPQIRVFAVSPGFVRELPVLPVAPLDDREPVGHSVKAGAVLDTAFARTKSLLTLDSGGRPAHPDNRAILEVIRDICDTHNAGAFDELVANGLLRGSRERFDRHIAPLMRALQGGVFEMGTSPPRRRHFCGESPSHQVELSPFAIARTPVTNALFSLFDQRRCDLPTRERQKPVVGVSWFDATVFALWIGCRLPTEAEWEFACASGSDGEWCCGEQHLLTQYAWYSENSGGQTHDVGTRQPNGYELFDLHGNVWEWCRDDYDQDYYSRSGLTNPIGVAPGAADKVCRGGSMHALAEMCRTRYRFHEPPSFSASDLGIRLARNQ